MARQSKRAKRRPASTRTRTTPRAPGLTGAAALVEQLEALDVEVVFGIPGVHNLAIFDALRRSKIRVVLVRHEATAAYAADGYARVTGRLGVCVTTTGPGAANTAAAMGEARAARSPILHISTQVPSRQMDGASGRGSLHESPRQKELMAAVSTWAGTVSRSDAIPSMIERAARAAFAGRRGPAFVEIPFDLLDGDVSWKPRPAPLYEPRRPDQRSVSRAVDVLRTAKKPVLWAGGGAISAGAEDEVRLLAEALDAPVVTTFTGKGVLPADHPLAVGLPPHQPEVTRLIENADAAVIVGSDLDAMNTQGWRLRLPRPRVNINTMAEDARRNYAADVVVEADARLAIEAILDEVKPTKRSGGRARVTRVQATVEGWAKKDREVSRAMRVVTRVGKSIPDNAVVVCDMSVGGYWFGAYHRAPSSRSFAYPLGWGTLGFGLPAAIGAATAGRPALAVVGDAGLMYAVGELATCVQEALPVVVLVINDEGYGMLRFDERKRFGAEFDVDLHTPDFEALAASMDVPAERATLNGVGAAVRRAFARGGPGLIEVRAALDPPLTTSPRWPLAGRKEARP